MDESCDLKGPYTDYMSQQKDVVTRFSEARKILEDDLVYIFWFVIGCVRSLWNIVSGIFLLTVFIFLWLIGEL